LWLTKLFFLVQDRRFAENVLLPKELYYRIPGWLKNTASDSGSNYFGPGFSFLIFAPDHQVVLPAGSDKDCSCTKTR